MSQSICSTGLRWLWLVVVVLIIVSEKGKAKALPFFFSTKPANFVEKGVIAAYGYEH